MEGRERGFTLVEVLVATAVTGIIMAAAFSLLFAGFKVQNLAVDEGRFAVSGQRVLSQIVDGKEGLVSARDVAIYTGLGFKETALVYLVELGGQTYQISYTYADEFLYRSKETATALAEPSAAGSLVLQGVGDFRVTAESGKISIRFASSQDRTVLETAVVPRNS